MEEEKIKIDLGSVQRTLLIPLLSWAKELEKEFPLRIDPFAKEIVARIDFDFSMVESAIDDSHQLVWIIRSINFDNNVREYQLDNKNALIVNT